MTPDLSIVIPALREADRIGDTLDTLAEYIQDNDFGWVEVAVVAAESTDGTAEIARSKSDVFPSFQIMELSGEGGKGYDVGYGIRNTTGSYRMFMDADLATPLHHLRAVKEYMDANTPIIIGVRDLHQSHSGVRKLISSFGNILTRWMLRLDITDTQCGFKAFRADVADNIFHKQTIHGWGFDMELLALAKQRGYDIETILLTDWEDMAGSTFKSAAVTGSLATLRDLIKIRWNIWRGIYD